jgi:chromate transporter
MDNPKMPQHGISLLAAFRVWLRISLLSFGGPAGQIAVMHRILIEEKRWISEDRFLHALNYCMLLPGPEAQQLATYIGWLMHRTLGGLIAGILFIIPGAIVILLLSILYAGYYEVKFVEALFFGIKAAVLAVVVEAVLRIGKRALKNTAMYTIAGGAFISIFFLAVPFPIVILAAAAIGLAGNKLMLPNFGNNTDRDSDIENHSASALVDSGIESDSFTHIKPSIISSMQILTIWLTIWLGPLVILFVTLGPTNIFVQEGLFFSKMAVVTFGGAYAVLAYVAQQAVENYGWLAPGEMLDGLGMAETTPGPLIMIVQFVGFMGAYRNPGILDPLTAGILGALLTTWVTFAPCFLWIFLGAPFIETLRGNKALAAALSAITAAVVGVILNLVIWFSLHVIFGEVNEKTIGVIHLYIPVWNTIDWAALLISTGALVATLKFHIGMIATLLASGAVGIAYFFTVNAT